MENLSEKSGQVFLKFLVKLRKGQFESKKSNSKFLLKIKSDETKLLIEAKNAW